MTYLIKHPISSKTPLFAVAYNNISYTISAGASRTVTMNLNTLVQSPTMSLTISSNAIVLSQKTYIVYFRVSIDNGTENQGCTVTPVLNGTDITSTNAIAAQYAGTVIASASAYTSPTPYSYISIDAQAGDLLSFKYVRTTGTVYSSTVSPEQCKVFIMEIET